MNTVLVVLIWILIFAVLALLVVLGVSYIIRQNTKEPKVNRKWTDGKPPELYKIGILYDLERVDSHITTEY